jgi:hypothetical protein
LHRRAVAQSIQSGKGGGDEYVLAIDQRPRLRQLFGMVAGKVADDETVINFA